MFGSNPQKTGLNTSQYDFKGVAVFIYLFRQNLHQVLISQLHQELEVLVLHQADLYQIEV
jgi:hypothetical protein